jgi:tRNA-2-methylthio-N6-dimethylallyladenosine synthase
MNAMKTKQVYIQTIGCQMNVYDSDRMERVLRTIGFIRTQHIKEADLILLNTCSVREKAEQKAFSFLGRLPALKEIKPTLLIGVGGCVAQQEGERILQRAPYVDLVFGTRAIDRLPGMVQKATEKRCRLIDVDLNETAMEPLSPEGAAGEDGMQPSRFVTIMRGCDNFCAYCVVPFVRGRETSRPPEEILSEIRTLVAADAREVTLLGQNVNSYGQKEGLCSFPELLTQVNAIEGLERIRFTTSHPKDLSPELIHAFGHLEKLCHHIHLPVQSGSDRILARMNRRYTRQMYLEKLAQLRAACPGIAVSSDIIVGFPGESAGDFQETLDLVETIGYDSLFAFAYSDRPHAPAVHFDGKVPETVRKARLQELLALQARITDEKHQRLVDTTVTVLVEGSAKRSVGGNHVSGSLPQWTGRTSTNKIVNFIVQEADGTSELTGKLVQVRIERALSHSLWGVAVCAGKGVKRHAA